MCWVGEPIHNRTVRRYWTWVGEASRLSRCADSFARIGGRDRNVTRYLV